MKALVLVEYNRFELQDVPIPTIADDEVLIAVRACSICGSDVHGMDGTTGRRRPPIIMGHEAAGVVADCGSAVGDLNVGDAVAFDSMLPCGRCWFCVRGRPNLCDSRKVLGVSCEEFRCQGALADYVAVPRRIVFRLPSALPFEHAAMAEPVSVGLHALGRATPRLGDAAVVIGAGAIGQVMAQALRRAGCLPVFAVDPDDHRRRLAVNLGATAAFPPDSPDLRMAVDNATAGRGADVAVDAVGLPATIDSAVSLVRKGGTVALIGNLAPQTPLALQRVVTREIALLGCCASATEYPDALRLIAEGNIQVAPLISALAPLHEAPQWFERLRSGDQGLLKVVIKPDPS